MIFLWFDMNKNVETAKTKSPSRQNLLLESSPLCISSLLFYMKDMGSSPTTGNRTDNKDEEHGGTIDDHKTRLE